MVRASFLICFAESIVGENGGSFNAPSLGLLAIRDAKPVHALAGIALSHRPNEKQNGDADHDDENGER